MILPLKPLSYVGNFPLLVPDVRRFAPLQDAQKATSLSSDCMAPSGWQVGTYLCAHMLEDMTVSCKHITPIYSSQGQVIAITAPLRMFLLNYCTPHNLQ
jgi:hypothetical protein